MGRLDSGLVMSLLFRTPGLLILYSSFSMFNIFTILYYFVVNLVVLLNVKLEISPMAVSMCLLVFWLLLVSCVFKQNLFSLHVVKYGLRLLWLRDIPLQQWYKPELRTGLRHSKACCFGRRNLPFNMALRCKDRPFKENGFPRNIPFFVCRETWTIKSHFTLRDRQPRRMRRRQRKSEYRALKRCVLDSTWFLNPIKSNTKLWNSMCTVNAEFLRSNTDSFSSHADIDVVPEDVMCKFVSDRANTFVVVSKLLSKLESADRSKGAE
jgi:hypothetical protein